MKRFKDWPKMKNYIDDLRDHIGNIIRLNNHDVPSAVTTLEYMYPELAHRIFTIKEYAYGPDAQDKDIDDPWGYPAEVYRKCAKEIYDALKLIVDKITNA